MWRAPLIALYLLLASAISASAGYPQECATLFPIPGEHPPPLESAHGAGGLSSFGGVTLASSPEEVAGAVASFGIVARLHGFEGHSRDTAWIALCKNGAPVGTIVFDESGLIKRIVLRASFFLDGPVHARGLVEKLFTAYSVTPEAIADDDECVSRAACFRGITRVRERLFVTQIGNEVELYVMPPK